ncbi:YceI family protein [Deminuibacter soli]|uniref:Polyisoprenoid-binding protein n=1 Tax=Deminuibacter soli TaxID=2291815 RepID=A0A3E1NCK5_9BACT|nr:YceI family protein [Deminuibacter soli]RFM25716.1 polyisoprenoid-binding protein [Deminuibacter soli]
MKKAVLFFAAALITLSSFAQTWKADPAHSKLAFTVTHMGISDISGIFGKFDVTIIAAKADFSDAVVELSTDVSSINTNVDMRDNHLKSPDFFDVAQFSTLTFKSTSLKANGNNQYTISGNLTLHGVTKPVSLTLVYRGTTTNPMSKATTAGVQVTGTIKRSDFNIGAKFPSAMVSDEVRIKADGEFIKQ